MGSNAAGHGAVSGYASGGGSATSPFTGPNPKSFFTMSDPRVMSFLAETEGLSWLNSFRNADIFPRASVEDFASALAP